LGLYASRNVGRAQVVLVSMLKIATSVSNEPEAQLLRGRLAGEGIESMLQRGGLGGARGGAGGACDVYVEEGDLERAREVLNAEPVSEAELIREEELAASSVSSSDTTDRDHGSSTETAEPKKHHLFEAFKKDHSG